MGPGGDAPQRLLKGGVAAQIQKQVANGRMDQGLRRFSFQCNGSSGSIETTRLGFAAVALACAADTFTGTITDDVCANDHASMRMASDAKRLTASKRSLTVEPRIAVVENERLLTEPVE